MFKLSLFISTFLLFIAPVQSQTVTNTEQVTILGSLEISSNVDTKEQLTEDEIKRIQERISNQKFIGGTLFLLTPTLAYFGVRMTRTGLEPSYTYNEETGEYEEYVGTFGYCMAGVGISMVVASGVSAWGSIKVFQKAKRLERDLENRISLSLAVDPTQEQYGFNLSVSF